MPGHENFFPGTLGGEIIATYFLVPGLRPTLFSSAKWKGVIGQGQDIASVPTSAAFPNEKEYLFYNGPDTCWWLQIIIQIRIPRYSRLQANNDLSDTSSPYSIYFTFQDDCLCSGHKASSETIRMTCVYSQNPPNARMLARHHQDDELHFC